MHNNNNHIYQYSGFLLIDLVISVGIFSAFCLLLTGVNWQLVKQEREIRLYGESINVAKNIIEEIRSKRTYVAQTIQKDLYTISIEDIPISLTSKKTTIKFWTIKITIHWKTGKDNQISVITSAIIL